MDKTKQCANFFGICCPLTKRHIISNTIKLKHFIAQYVTVIKLSRCFFPGEDRVWTSRGSIEVSRSIDTDSNMIELYIMYLYTCTEN